MIESISPPVEMVKKQIWGFWATVGLGLVVGVIFIIVQTLAVIPFAVTKFINNTDLSLEELTNQLMSDGNLLSTATVASAIICSGLVLIMVKVRRGATIPEYLALKPISLKAGLVMLAVTIGFIALSYGVNHIPSKSLDSDFIAEAYRNVTSPPFFWIAMVIFAPIFEELFIRGFLFIGFRQSRLGPAGAVILTALIWASLHIQYGLFQIAAIFILGIILGIVRHKTGSILNPLIIHTLNNLLAMVSVSLY